MAQQYQTVAVPKRIELFTSITARGNSFDTDSYLSNCFLEKDPNDGQIWIRKRPGFSSQVGGAGVGGAGGIYTFRNTILGPTVVLSVVGGSVYKNIVGTVLLGTTASGGNNFRFETMNYTGLTGSRVALLHNAVGGEGYYTDGITFNSIPDINFPTSRGTGWAYLDDTMYVITTNGDIRGSNIADPTIWDPLNSIAARDEGDFAVGIAKHMSYVVALKEWSIQFFYNAGNAVGSPLTRLPGSKLSIGCTSGDTVRDVDGELFLVGVSRGVNPFVVKLVNLRPQIVSNESVSRILATGVTGPFAGTWTSLVLTVGGHKFYVITSSHGNFTLAYDVQYGNWYRWTSPTGGRWTPVASTYAEDSLLGSTTNQVIVQDSASSRIHVCNVPEISYSPFASLTGDNDVAFPVDIYTQNHDFGTIRGKQLGQMYFTADQLPTNMTVRYSDDDRQTWSNFREINLDVAIPSLPDCGSFKKRAWNFRHFAPEAFRLKTTDLQMDIGTL